MALDEAWLQSLIADAQEEHERLEFKKALSEFDGRGKHEFLKDVSAMANAGGGQIIFGVDEEDGVAARLNSASADNPDSAITRLAQSLDSCVEPRIAGVRFDPVALESGGYALVVHVPQSFAGPHRVTLNGKNAFYVRAQRHVAEFSYAQLKEAFNVRARAEDRIEEFRAERLAKIKANAGPRRLWKDCRYVIHLLPLVSFAGSQVFDVSHYRRQAHTLLFGYLGSVSGYWNLDGVVAGVHADKSADSKYVQLFRSGAIEAAGFAGLHADDRKLIPSQSVAGEIREGLSVLSRAQKSLGVDGPIAVGLSLLSVGDHQFAISDGFSSFPTPDRDDLVLPPLWAESADSILADPDSVARPVLDTLWQCFNLDSCEYYDESGRWLPR